MSHLPTALPRPFPLTYDDQETSSGVGIQPIKVPATKVSPAIRRSYLDEKSVKALRDQENARSLTFPQSPENRGVLGSARLSKDPPEDVPPVGEFRRGNEIKMTTKGSLPNR